MTELLHLIELNEIKQIRITCKKCGTAVKMPVDNITLIKKCPHCGEEFGRLHDAFIDLKNMLKNTVANDTFAVHIELMEDLT